MTGSGVALVDGTRIHYRRAGVDGPPVVLLHGAGVDDADLSWRHAIPALTGPDDDEARVWAPNWPGYGDSEPVRRPSTERYVDVLEGFLDSVGLDGATLVGLSMGGAAALGLALREPERVDRLCLVASYGLGERVTAGSWWYAMAHTPGANTLGWNAVGATELGTRVALSALVHDVDHLSPAFVEAFRRRAGEPDAGAAFAAFQRREVTPDGRVRTDYSDRLADLAVPTLLVHGASDRVFPVAWSRRAADRIPDATLEVVEDCGHWVPRERPEWFEGRLRRFCQSNRPVER